MAKGKTTMAKFNLIGVGSNAKTIKGDGAKFETGILYMLPYEIEVDGKTFNSCPMADKAQCHAPCLNTAGRAGIVKKGETTNPIQKARQRKAEYFYRDRDGFMRDLIRDVIKHRNKCNREGVKPVIRLNGTTDIRFESIRVEHDGQRYAHIFELFPDVQFYDYTKIPNRRRAKGIPNYHLTWSYSEADPTYAALFDEAIESGNNVAVVFRKKLPETFRGLPVVDGDKDDLRFTDPSGVVVGLKAKGKAKHDKSGFVIDA